MKKIRNEQNTEKTKERKTPMKETKKNLGKCWMEAKRKESTKGRKNRKKRKKDVLGMNRQSK